MKQKKRKNVAGKKLTTHVLEMLRAISDGINETIYISDPDTYEVLFANRKTKEEFGRNIIGKKCHDVFRKEKRPCPSCTNKRIFGKNLGKTYIWDHQNKWNKRWYKGICKAVPWSGGKYVRYGMAIDITKQKDIQRALKLSEEKFYRFAENARDVIYRYSFKKGLEYINPISTQITGYAPEDYYSDPELQLKLIHPENYERPLKLDKDFRRHRQRKHPALIRWIHKDGHIVFTEQVNVPIYDEAGRLIAVEGISRDVTERTRIGEKLEDSESRYRSLFENSPVSLWEQDHSEIKNYIDGLRESGIRDFRIYFETHPEDIVRLANLVEVIAVNKATLKLYNAKNKHDLGRCLSQVFGLNEFEAFKEELIAIGEGKKTFETELTTQTTTGEEIHVVLKVSIPPSCEKTLSKLFVSMVDVTEERKMENELRNSEEFFRSVVENSHNGILIIDDKFNIVYANDEVLHLSGYSKEEVVGQDFRKFLDEHSKGLVQERYVRRRKGEEIPNKYEFRIVRKNGETRCVETKSAVIRDKHGNLLSVAQLHDVTEHKTMDEERRRFEERLSALNEYGQNLNMAKTPEEIYNLTLNAMERTLGFEFATFFMVEGKKLRLTAHRGYPEKLNVALPMDGARGVTIKSAMSGKPIFIPDIRKEVSYVPGRPGMLSELAVPMRVGKKVLGVLNVESERLSAFNADDRKLLEILASHAATSVSNLNRRDELRKLSSGLEHLMKSTTEVMHVKEMHQRLEVIASAIEKFGWRRVVISLRDENLEGTDLVTVGLTKKEKELLAKRKAPGQVWRKRLGPEFERYKINEFYYLPWSDPWIRENVHGLPPGSSANEATTYAGVPSRLSTEEMIDWHPQDMLYAPLLTPEGRIVGILSMDDPVDGRRPVEESFAPLELFLHQAAMVIENAQLIESLKEVRTQLEAYTQQLEQMVDIRTRELRKSQEQLLKAQRLAVIGELAGMVGHDLRNPLTSIAGATYYVKKNLRKKTSCKLMEMLDLIENNIGYSNKIINDLLDYSREIKLDLTLSDPRSMVQNALVLIAIPKNVRLVDLTEKEPKLRIDNEKMKRVFANLIKNATDAMPRGGTLTIESKNTRNYVEFVFADTGTGMTEETREKLWTPLFTTKAKGMGFGLPICKRFIEAHGGSISVESILRKGTTFTIVLPIEPKAKEEGGGKIWIRQPESSLLTMTKT